MNTFTVLTLSTVMGTMMATTDVAAADLSKELNLLVQQQSIQLSVDATKRVRQALTMTAVALKARREAFEDAEQFAQQKTFVSLNTMTEAE